MYANETEINETGSGDWNLEMLSENDKEKQNLIVWFRGNPPIFNIIYISLIHFRGAQKQSDRV